MTAIGTATTTEARPSHSAQELSLDLIRPSSSSTPTSSPKHPTLRVLLTAQHWGRDPTPGLAPGLGWVGDADAGLQPLVRVRVLRGRQRGDATDGSAELRPLFGRHEATVQVCGTCSPFGGAVWSGGVACRRAMPQGATESRGAGRGYPPNSDLQLRSNWILPPSTATATVL